MKKFLFVILFLFIVGGGVTLGSTLGHKSAPKTEVQSVLPAHESVAKSTVAPTVAEVGIIPQHIKIPKIAIDTTVESIGMDSKGRMDVPKDSDNTAWFQTGYKPGQNGNAVIDGHYDKATGAPSVFYNLTKLAPGDKIIVSDSVGKSLTFSVVRLENYPDDNFPIKEVFGPAAKPFLNLITCQGKWNEESHNYSQRGVVYAELMQ